MSLFLIVLTALIGMTAGVDRNKPKAAPKPVFINVRADEIRPTLVLPGNLTKFIQLGPYRTASTFQW